MKLASSTLQTACVLLSCWARTCISRERSGGTAGFLSQSDRSSHHLATAAEGDEPIYDAAGEDMPDDGAALQGTPDKSQVALLKGVEDRPGDDLELQSPPDGRPAAAPSPPLAAVEQKTVVDRKQAWQGLTDNSMKTRPSAEEGSADVVTFGLFAKQFYDTDLKKNLFAVDNVMSLMWKDERVAKLVPEGLEYVTLSERAAEKQIWMPDIRITNREIRGYEHISTGVTITKDGIVTKVERSLVRAKNFFRLKEYPWDVQHLKLKIASTRYMLNELKLKPSKDSAFSGCNPDIFDDRGYQLEKFETYEFEEGDGSLQKSRGVMEMTVKRDIKAYEQSHLLPTFTYLAISCAVFWFPFVVQFITPRLALSILALLTFTNLSIATSKNLPLNAPFNWNDLFNQIVQACMCTTIILNIYTEIAFHQLKCEEVAKAMNHECKVVLPIISIITLSTVLGNAASDDGMSLETTSIFVKVIMFVLIAIYALVCAKRLHDDAIKHFGEITKNIVATHAGSKK